MIPMTAGAIVRAFQEYDPNEQVLIGWWDKECLEPEFVTEGEDGNDVPLDPETAQRVWEEVMSSAEGRFDRDSEYIYTELGAIIFDEIAEIEKETN